MSESCQAQRRRRSSRSRWPRNRQVQGEKKKKTTGARPHPDLRPRLAPLQPPPSRADVNGGGSVRILTGHGQVGVGLRLPRHVSGEALEHSGVVGQEAVHLQAAPGQDPVARRLHRVDGRGVLVPDDVGLRRSCDRPAALAVRSG